MTGVAGGVVNIVFGKSAFDLEDKQARRGEREREFGEKAKRAGLPGVVVARYPAEQPLTAKDCVLFLWTGLTDLNEALKSMRSWGFKYKTSFVVVTDVGQCDGFCVQNHETCLVGTIGKVPAPALGTQSASVFRERDAFDAMVARLFSSTPKICLP